MTVLSKSHQGKEQKERKSGGKTEWKLFEVNTMVVPRGQNELIGEFKMAVGHVISIGGKL
jgi:hypothetical protein